MKIVREPQVLLGMLEGGEFVGKLQHELSDTLRALAESAGPKGKASGHVTVKMALKVEAGMVTITPELTSKKPKEEFGPSTFWVTEDGELSTQHPRQTDMFSGPRDASDREFG
ncbi:hypothetical protein [Aureimonas phyllosphaerae]|uniref:Uncharacterized protein n=1 Tax=Aureimonas phyllosphaerae TaxID=1166078 RepID=A0A7W6C3R0_9HYPH|nr:hypothetical protein [Aureimonas phyllosphaerae]MBB3937902.1 hypothetical protein [Aureimonas phyllosphaerae]MBB3961925.1 hypothetical protein [Aureimonas phyllosphaerae]SFF54738.1 hypothetical protein SAMN05216566_12552 [Aureimonas phyllosphaerae]